MSPVLKERKSAFCEAVDRMSTSSASFLMPVMEEVVHQEGNTAVFLARAIRALMALAPQANLLEAISAPSDYELLLNALQQTSVSQRLAAVDPLAQAKIRGISAKRQLLEAEGGCFSSNEAAKALGISREAVNKRRQQGKLIGLPEGRSFRYPIWQFQAGQTLPGLETVLKHLKVQDPWMQIAWMLNDNLRLGRSPLAQLQSGSIQSVAEAACLYGEQGAS
jgi:hypothetical protein